MFIQIENTPNPLTQKFLPGQEVKAGAPLEFANPEDARTSPLANRIFSVDGVTSVFLGPDFVSVSKTDDKNWTEMKAPILSAIMEHFQSGDPVVVEGVAEQATHAEHHGEDGEVVEQIKQLLDSRVRPAVEQDGGDIVFHGFERGVVYLQLKGACAGCPSSTMTLKMGIENLLRHYIPDVTEVRAIA